MKLYFVNRFFYPDFSATSQMLTDLTVGLATDPNHDVTVVTSRALYNDPLAKLERRDENNGVEILRLNTTRMGRDSLPGRLLDYVSFYIRVCVFLARNVRSGDLVVLKTDPPLMSLVNTAVVRFKGGQVINWLQDLFPEIAIELGAFPRNMIFSGPLTWWRNRSLRAAAVNVVISEKMKQFLVGQGVTNTIVISNWADGEFIQPLDHTDNVLRAEWNPDKQFLVGYSGNFGRAHSFDELLTAMTLLESRDEIRFVLIGEGAGLDQLLEAVERKHLHHVNFYPYQPHDMLRQSLGAIDLHVVTLKKRMEGLVYPSKIYGVLAAGRPLAFIGDEDGEIENLVRGRKIGFAVAHGGGTVLAEKIQQLANESTAKVQMGRNARQLFDEDYDKKIAINNWSKLLHFVARNSNEFLHGK